MEIVHPFGKKFSVLVLDYARPREGETLLGSIQHFLGADAQITYLVNGAQTPQEIEPYFQFYRQGWIDKLIVNKHGNGAGFGHLDLLRQCDTPYFMFLQVDQVLTQPITDSTINYFVNLLESGLYQLVDLSGDQSNKGIYSDRGHFGNTKFFQDLGIEKYAGGGPGIFQSTKRWNENYLQEVFASNNYKIAHIKPTIVGDNGKLSIRSVNGGILYHFTDEKTLFVLQIPKEKDEWYRLLDSEWEEIFSGKWPKEGKIPENYKNSSFKVW